MLELVLLGMGVNFVLGVDSKVVLVGSAGAAPPHGSQQRSRWQRLPAQHFILLPMPANPHEWHESHGWGQAGLQHTGFGQHGVHAGLGQAGLQVWQQLSL